MTCWTSWHQLTLMGHSRGVILPNFLGIWEYLENYTTSYTSYILMGYTTSYTTLIRIHWWWLEKLLWDEQKVTGWNSKRQLDDMMIAFGISPWMGSTMKNMGYNWQVMVGWWLVRGYTKPCFGIIIIHYGDPYQPTRQCRDRGFWTLLRYLVGAWEWDLLGILEYNNPFMEM
jgi:hypothetical protein